MAPPALPPADARRPEAEPGAPAAPAPGPHAFAWPPPAPIYRTTPPPPVRTTMPPPWEVAKPAPRIVTDPAAEAQRLAAALGPATPADAPLGDASPVDTGVWMSARGSVEREAPRDRGIPAEPRPIAVGRPVKGPPPSASALRSEAPPPPNPTDDSPIVSHRGARWQN